MPFAATHPPTSIFPVLSHSRSPEPQSPLTQDFPRNQALDPNHNTNLQVLNPPILTTTKKQLVIVSHNGDKSRLEYYAPSPLHIRRS